MKDLSKLNELLDETLKELNEIRESLKSEPEEEKQNEINLFALGRPEREGRLLFYPEQYTKAGLSPSFIQVRSNPGSVHHGKSFFLDTYNYEFSIISDGFDGFGNEVKVLTIKPKTNH